MQDYKKLNVWSKSHTLELYTLTKSFPKEELYGLTNQLRRAGTSIPANIAEGCGRHSKNDTTHFFQIALGSIHEVGYYILLSKDLNYITIKEFETQNILLSELKAMMIALIKKARS